MIWVLLAVPLLYALHRAGLWMESRGWIYYRKRHGGSGALSSAVLEVQSLFEPSKRHVIEVMQSAEPEIDHSDDGANGRLRIRRAAPGDAQAVAQIAARTFHDTFADSNNAGDLALYMDQAYGVEQQGAEIVDPRIETLLAESDGALIAYAMIRDEPPPECVAGPAPIELWRFYVRKEWHGRGVAQRLMAAVDGRVREKGARTLWLGVWERNFRAQAFYRKSGFVDVGSHIFLVGTDPQTDRIYVRPVAPAAEAPR